MIKKVTQVNALLFTLAFITYPGLFIFNPFQGGASVLSFLQVLSLFASLLAVVLPFWGRDFYSLGKLGKSLFILSFFLWPVSLLSVRALSLIALGDPGFGYLLSYPVFIFTDLMLPLSLLFIFVKDLVVAKVKRNLALEQSANNAEPQQSPSERMFHLD